MKLTKELIEKYDDDSQMFYRFQNPEWEVGDVSFGMIYSTEEEARQDFEDMGLDPEEAVLPGKSCMDTFAGIMSMRFVNEFDKDFNLIVFNGYDTGVSGHDDECVAEYYETVETFDFDEACQYAELTIWNN
ncbi:hypothetical protein GH810_14030 [Acetobacterium paludosum]|uniref:Uncharacterized protein n=1 Tax=Acetobacterium paludosum TaxID=52693 RepID=A0A923KQS0_9FIRM|nr:hypothetical protein [Acetobacterium paludosum]MBC3889429.1 hypothetical protein [Acetobacterium paludosum]